MLADVLCFLLRTRLISYEHPRLCRPARSSHDASDVIINPPRQSKYTMHAITSAPKWVESAISMDWSWATVGAKALHSTGTVYSHAMRLLSSLGLLSLAYVTTANTVVDLGYARYRGNLSNPNTVAYLGLPYAEPPVGNLRWRAPLPLNTARVSKEAHGAVVDATVYPEFCIQGTTGCGSAYSVILCTYVSREWTQLVMPEVRVVRTASKSMYTRHPVLRREKSVCILCFESHCLSC